MHIPDGFLDARVWAGAAVMSAGAVGYAVRRTKEVLDDRQVPVMGVMAAFIFAAQMINFPVAPGASGHLLGGALVAILMGPWTATLLMTTVYTIQALIFQDGGITTLGANILNSAVIAPWVALWGYRALKRVTGDGAAVFLSAWLSLVVAAGAAGVQLALSGTVPLGVVLPAILGWHMLIGIGEGLITGVAVRFARQNLPPALDERWV